MKGDKDSTADVVVNFDPSGCKVCWCKLIERHRIRLGGWGGKYTAGNIVLLCPTHHKLMHVLINWNYAQAVRQWRPWTKQGENLIRIIRYIQADERKLWDLYWDIQHPAVRTQIEAVASGTPGFWPQEVDEIEVWKHDELMTHQFEDWEE